MTTEQDHWQRIYEQREPQKVSWYEPVAELSLALVEDASLPSDAAILDAGGGTSRLARLPPACGQLLGFHGGGHLAGRHYSERGPSLESWPNGSTGLWLTRAATSSIVATTSGTTAAVFHFMVDVAVATLTSTALDRSLCPGGHLILATFGSEGPTRCSGLPVHRYSTKQLARLLEDEFEILSSRQSEHRTPSGIAQQFV